MLRTASWVSCFCLLAACGRSHLGAPELEQGGGGSGGAPPGFCGDGVVDRDESCDDGNTIDDDGCTNDCALFTCGNGQVDDGEQCDGGTDGATCESQGFGPGELGCLATCVFDTSGCSSCGNGIIDGSEQCDGADLGGQTCESLGLGQGELLCTDSCLLNVFFCEETTCGNGQVDANEQCDGGNLAGQTCQSLGFDGGTLLCAQCLFDTGDCAVCGNGNVEPGETCDDANTQSGDGCSSTCQVEACGNGVLEPGEQCDLGAANEDRWALAYGLGLPATGNTMLRPFDNPQSAVSFFNYFSASSHTGFEGLNTSRIYFYRNSTNSILSLIFHHGVDQTTTGLVQPLAQVDWFFSGIPGGTFIAATDDDLSELFPTGGGSVEGHWQFQNNSDGGVIAGFPFPGDWEVLLEATFAQGITNFELIDQGSTFTSITGETFVTFLAQTNPSACRTSCTVPSCGDGLFDAGEVCDDGNNVSNDGCAADCAALD